MQVENRFPWANEVDYLISFKVDPDFSSFDDSSYLFLGVIWELKEGSRRDPANQQWRIPLKAADFAAPQLIDGRKYYRITIDPLKNEKLRARIVRLMTALELLRNRHFDKVFTDIWMPDMNGMDLLAEIRRDPQLKDLPVIAITADADFADKPESKGFDGVYIKPVMLKTLAEFLKMP